MTNVKKVLYTIRLDPAVVDILKMFSKTEGREIGEIVESAIKQHLIKEEKHVPSS